MYVIHVITCRCTHSAICWAYLVIVVISKPKQKRQPMRHVTPQGTHLHAMCFLFTFRPIFRPKGMVYQALDAVTYQASFPGYGFLACVSTTGSRAMFLFYLPICFFLLFGVTYKPIELTSEGLYTFNHLSLINLYSTHEIRTHLENNRKQHITTDPVIYMSIVIQSL
jgi:hypothetical protein